MDFTPITHQEIFQLIQELNAFADEMDDLVLRTQQQYKARKVALTEEGIRNLSRFDSDCEAAIATVKAKSQHLIADAHKIQSEMRSIDEHLVSVDKYYIKTKIKKEAELTGVKDEHYNSYGDYFETLSQIKNDYSILNRKYSDDILPGLINGLNYLFSNKRKRDYEELIILLNTVEAFVNEISSVMPELTAEAVLDMRSTHELHRTELVTSQKAAMASLDDQFNRVTTSIATSIDAKLNAIFPDELVNYIAHLMNCFISSFGKVNSTSFIANNILALGLVDYPIAEFIQSQTLALFINNKCKTLMVNGSIKFPMFYSTGSSLSLYIKKDETNSEVVRQLVHGIMFSFLSATFVSKLRLSIIDCENHGISVEPYFDAKKKMPELFDEQIYTTYDGAAAKIRSLNEEVERVSQNVLGTQFASIFGFAKENSDNECGIELLTIFDFPKGLDENALSSLENIIVHGPRCGIYVTITESNELSADTYSKEFISHIAKIREKCMIVQQENASFSIMGLRFLYYTMPARNDFNAFFSKYILINEGIRNRGIAFPPLIKRLVDIQDEKGLDQNIQDVRDIMCKYDDHYGQVPDVAAPYPEQVMIGLTQYPLEIFVDSFGYEKIKENFATKQSGVLLPLLLDLSQSANLSLTFDENKSTNAAALIHHIIWCFLSTLPVTKANVVIFDAEKKGGNAVPFLGFKKNCPDVFDGYIYSNADDIYDRLNRLNRHIDNLIQDKLGNRFANLLDYNRCTPNRAEAITILVVYDFPSSFDSRSIGILKNILKNGGRCGVYTLICHNRDIRYSSYESFDEHKEAYLRYCTQIELSEKTVALLPFNLPMSIKDPLSPTAIDRFVDEYKKTSDIIKSRGLAFADILERDLFSKNSEGGLSIPVGVGDGESIVSITFGVGSSHHALVAGATGSGKSTLLHTLIMSAMLHYSPEFLHLYLMDFKSGTEFKSYDSKRLPHIKLLALDAMQEFGESILENLVAEMGKRSEKFKSVGASKLGEYVKLSGEPMPKILVIMDEFQVLYNDSTNRKVAYNCAELTKRIVTEGRSFGIHMLMATQSTKIISDLTLATGTVEQMRIRIGLKCGEWDANYLFSERNDARALEMMKGPIGTAVMNPEYTESELIGFRTAYCDDDTQEEYLDLIAKKFSKYPYDLQTFEGGRTVPLLTTGCGLSGLQAVTPLSIEVGTLIKVAPPLKVIIDRRRKHNTLICGSSDRMSENLTNLYMLAILKNSLSKLYCFDGERLLGPSAADSYYVEFSRFKGRFVIADTRGEMIRFISDVYDAYTERKKKNSSDQIFILIRNLQFLDIVKTMLKGETIDETDYVDDELTQKSTEDLFDFGVGIDVSSMNISEKLLKLIDDGTAYGIHFIVTSLEYQSVKESMYYGENILSKFPERYVFALNDNDSESLIENISVAALRDNTVYYSDSIKNTCQIKPYSFPSTDELHRHIDSMLVGGEG